MNNNESKLLSTLTAWFVIVLGGLAIYGWIELTGGWLMWLKR